MTVIIRHQITPSCAAIVSVDNSIVLITLDSPTNRAVLIINTHSMRCEINRASISNYPLNTIQRNNYKNIIAQWLAVWLTFTADDYKQHLSDLVLIAEDIAFARNMEANF